MKKAYGEPKRLTGKTRELIKAIDRIVTEYDEKGMKITVRQVYYQCVSRKILDNSKDSYTKISDVIAKGRLAGLIDWEAIEDRGRYVRSNAHWDSPQQIIQAAAEQYRINTRATQPYYIECWIEKDSLVSILEKTCNSLDVPCFSCRGFASITALYEAAQRFRGKKNAVILYAGDHDPSGLKIPQTIIERLNEFEVDVRLERIGLTLDQINALNLPPYPAKEKDNNFKEYYQNTGLTEAWELDALPPDTLSAIFESAINRYTDFYALDKMRKLEKQHKSYFSKIM